MKKLQLTIASFLLLTLKAYSYPVPDSKNILFNFGTPSKEALDPKNIKVLVWNLHKGTEPNFQKDFLYLSKDKDLVLIEEMLLDQNMMGVFNKQSSARHFSTATSFYTGKEQSRTGVANSSTVLPVSVDYLKTQILEPVVNSPKVTIITTYPLKDRQDFLTVANIHAINFVDIPSFELEMNRLYEKLKNVKGPLILAGDFNTWNPVRLTIMNKVRAQLKLNEAEFYPDQRMLFDIYPLDHFYYSKHIRVLNAKVDGSYNGSDHKPLELELDIIKEDM